MASQPTDFVELVDEGITWYVFTDGTRIPALRGGADDDPGGDGDAGGEGDDGSDDASSSDATDAGDDAGAADKAKGKDDGDWKSRSRSWERKAKAALKERDELKQAQQAAADASKSDHDKALEKARQETEEKIRGEAQAELRTERLDSAVARLAAGRFTDVDDALLRIQAAIRSGELDEEEVFVDNKVQTEPVRAWLGKLLKDKPHLAGKASVNGDADAGKGGGGKSVNDMSIDDHLKSIQKTR